MKCQHPHRRFWLYLLILLAVAAQGLVPSGFMPSMRGAGDARKVEIVICTGTGPATILMDAHAVPGAADDAVPAGDFAPACPFAPVLTPGLAALMPPADGPGPAIMPSPPVRLAAPRDTAVAKDWFAQGPPRA